MRTNTTSSRLVDRKSIVNPTYDNIFRVVSYMILVCMYAYIILLSLSFSYTFVALRENDRVALSRGEQCKKITSLDGLEGVEKSYITVGEGLYYDAELNVVLQSTDAKFTMNWLLENKVYLCFATCVLGFAFHYTFDRRRTITFFWIVGFVSLLLEILAIFACFK